MEWVKKGLIFRPDGSIPWMRTHAAAPIPLHLEGDIYRIYFSTRNETNKSQIGYVEVHLNHPYEPLKVSEAPVLALGRQGYFDCDGLYAGSLVKGGGRLYLYYSGWNAGIHGSFYSSIGLAVSNDYGLTFTKYSEAPIMARSEVDKWAVMGPFVLKEGPLWKMWYISGLEAFFVNGAFKSRYDIKYALSSNGVDWEPTGITSIDLGRRDTNIARACVIGENGGYKAYYSYISKHAGQYMIGYSESADGRTFVRLDDRIGLDVSPSGWDSQALAYPFVFSHGGRKYMLYNGNQFGKDGFGLAVFE